MTKCIESQDAVYIRAVSAEAVAAALPAEIYFLLQNGGRYKSYKEAVKRHGNIKRGKKKLWLFREERERESAVSSARYNASSKNVLCGGAQARSRSAL